MSRNAGWFLLLTFALVAGVVLWWQHATLGPLRAEITTLRDQQNVVKRLREEQSRLGALQVSAAELARLRADHAAADQLRSEISQMRARLERKPMSTSAPPRDGERFSAGVGVRAAEWKNAGAATPAAALETALWAAAGGDVEALARRLLLDGKAKEPAKALLESLPATRQAEFSSPERLIAFLSIKDVPTGEAKVREWMPPSGLVQGVEVALTTPEGVGKEVRLLLVQEPQSTEWKLAVTPAAIAKHAAMLKESSVASGRK